MLGWLLKQSERDMKYAVLYDIGCNMEKGIIKVSYHNFFWMAQFSLFFFQRDLFSDESRAGLLMFGTSVFHAFVHQWSCQIQYNPRLNMDWGLSDGEGMERIWSRLASLISGLRYSTKAHRLAALNLRGQHHNEAGRTNLSTYIYLHL